jgi:hypothetical protein
MQELSAGLLALGPLIREIPPSPCRRRRVPGALAAGRHRRTRNGAARARTPPLPPEPRPTGLFHSPTARPSCRRRRRTRSVKLKRVREMFFSTVRVSVVVVVWLPRTRGAGRRAFSSSAIRGGRTGPHVREIQRPRNR